jgi:hypothetical protein
VLLEQQIERMMKDVKIFGTLQFSCGRQAFWPVMSEVLVRYLISRKVWPDQLPESIANARCFCSRVLALSNFYSWGF